MRINRQTTGDKSLRAQQQSDRCVDHLAKSNSKHESAPSAFVKVTQPIQWSWNVFPLISDEINLTNVTKRGLVN